MSIIKQALTARTALNVTGLATLASATYVASDIYTANTNQPLDVAIEIDAATTNTPSGNKRLMVFLQESLDGTNFRSGPTSGTSATDEHNLLSLGVIPMNSVTTTQKATFSVAQTLGYVPYAFRVVIKNDLGVALTSAAVYTSEVTTTVV